MNVSVLIVSEWSIGNVSEVSFTNVTPFTCSLFNRYIWL